MKVVALLAGAASVAMADSSASAGCHLEKSVACDECMVVAEVIAPLGGSVDSTCKQFSISEHVRMVSITTHHLARFCCVSISTRLRCY
jgi:hypothetical protein